VTQLDHGMGLQPLLQLAALTAVMATCRRACCGVTVPFACVHCWRNITQCNIADFDAPWCCMTETLCHHWCVQAAPCFCKRLAILVRRPDS
jgi:hypothetical protein